MNEKELGKALLQLDADKVAAEPNAAQLSQPILNRDKRRVRLLTGLTIATWVVADQNSDAEHGSRQPDL
jgi:hypothetical protein